MYSNIIHTVYHEANAFQKKIIWTLKNILKGAKLVD